MIPRLKPNIGVKELIAAFRVPRHDDVEQFERSFALSMGQKYALAFPYGRSGLIFLLEALGLKGREIICPAYTCVVVPHAIVFSGNKPVFVDCKQGDFNVDLDQVEKAITDNTGAIIATSIFGYPIDLDRLDAIRRRYPRIFILQDCAHSFAAKWNGRPVQKEGIAALFGLNISKTVTSIFGGMITTNDENLYKALSQLRNIRLKDAGWKKDARRLFYFLTVYPVFWGPVYEIVNRIERSGLIDHFVKYYDEKKINMPNDYLQRMAGVEARVGEANLTRYEDIVKKRKQAAYHYFERLIDRKDFRLPPKVEGATYSHFVVLVKERETWLKKALDHGIQLGSLIEYNIPEMKAYGAHLSKDFPIAAAYARNAINLPVWCGETIARIVIQKLSKIIISK